MVTVQRFTPFSSVPQFDNWQAANCHRCTKEGECPVLGALWLAFVTNGTVSADIARRMGYIGNEAADVWTCPESECKEVTHAAD